MNISLELRALEETPKRFFQYLRDESAPPAGEFSGKSRDYELTRLRDFVHQCILLPKKCLIYRRWAYQVQQTTEFLLRPSPDCLSEEFADSLLAFVCQMSDDGSLVITAGESRSGEADERFEKLYDGYLTIATCSIWERMRPTDEEGRLFLRYLPEVGVDLNIPLAAWTNYLDWRQLLAERKAKEGYAYHEYKVARGRNSIDFYLTHPNVRELLKTRLSGETIRVFDSDEKTSSSEPQGGRGLKETNKLPSKAAFEKTRLSGETIRVFDSDESSSSEPEKSRGLKEANKRPPKAAFEGDFRSVSSSDMEHSTRGQGRYNLRHVGKPKGDPEALIVRLVIDPSDERKGFSISDVPDCGVLKAAMEGELAAVDIQRNGLRRLAEYQGLNPNVRQWLFNPVAAKPIAQELRQFSPDSRLNEEQLECVRKALALEDLLLLWGPPGTGKTTVIAEISSQYCRLGLFGS